MAELEAAGRREAPRYDVTNERMQQLASDLLQEKAGQLPSAQDYRYVAVEVNGDTPYANIGRTIERTVFEEVFTNDTAFMEREYGAYEANSTFFISVDQETRQATGVLRIIHNSDEGLKSWDDGARILGVRTDKTAQLEGLDDFDKVWDVGTIAVLPEFRDKSGPVSILLERAMYLSATEHDIQALVSIIDTPALIKLRDILHIPFQPLPGSTPQPYLGSEESWAVYGYVPDFFKEMNRYRKSPRGRMANFVLHHALDRLIIGTADAAIILLNDYKNQNA